jgi:aminoglycoside phosphotransferase (APT) family kinase protein
LPGWEPVRDLRSEVEFWTPLNAKAAEPVWAEMGERTGDLLLSAVPESPFVGLFHGDFQTNNVLFQPADGSVVAVLDWEISGVGAQLLDLGWLLFMNDADSWADAVGLGVVPSFERIVGWYAEATGRDVTLDDVAFFRALSGYRFGVISGLNVMLHRTGKRHDPEWDRIALSVPHMFEQACRLLGG